MNTSLASWRISLSFIVVLSFTGCAKEPADTAKSLQALLDKGGDVTIPAGTYELTTPLVVDLDKVGFTSISGNGVARLIMRGPGPAVRITGTHGGTADPKSVKPNVWERQRMPLIDGLEIVGAHPEACGIEAVGTMQLTISRTTIRESLHGIHLRTRNRNVTIADVHIYQNRGVGIYLDNVNLHQINVSNSHISYNAQGGIVNRGGNVRNLHVTGCDIEGNMGDEKSPPSANVLLDSTGGEAGIGEVAITGCTIQHTRAAPGSANIRILGKSKEHHEGHVVIGNNVLSDTQVNVEIKNARDVIVTGNTFWTGITANLLVEDSSNVVLNGNLCDRNPRYQREDSGSNMVVFRRCRDCTIKGLHLNGVRGEAGLLVEDSERFNIVGCTILDCEKVALLGQGLTNSRISDCLIQHANPPGDWIPLAAAGKGNQIVDNQHPAR